MVEPEFSNPWGAELILKSEWSNDKWQTIDFPSDIRSQVKLAARVKVDGRDYVVPNFGVGSIIATGKTPEEAIQEIKDIAGEIKGYGLEFHTESLDKALEEFNKISYTSLTEARRAP